MTDNHEHRWGRLGAWPKEGYEACPWGLLRKVGDPWWYDGQGHIPGWFLLRLWRACRLGWIRGRSL